MNETDKYSPEMFEALRLGMGFHELGPENDLLESACQNLFKSEVYARGWVFKVEDERPGNNRFEFHLQNNINDRPVISRKEKQVEAEGKFFSDMRALRTEVGDLFRILVLEHDAHLAPIEFQRDMQRIRAAPDGHRVVWSGNISPRNPGLSERTQAKVRS